MLTEMQTKQTLKKLKRLEDTLASMMFETVANLNAQAYSTKEALHAVPAEALFSPCAQGQTWEGEGLYCWFRSGYHVPKELAGKDLFIQPRIEAYEGMLWVDGRPCGNFANKIIVNSHGNHYCNLLKQNAVADETLDIALEYYSHHLVVGTQPFTKSRQTFRIVYSGVDICLKNTFISDCYYKLKIANQMVETLDVASFRRAALLKQLEQVHRVVYYDPENAEKDAFLNGLKQMNDMLTVELAKVNSASAPFAGLVGHSHMDTAWLWHMEETIKKCARTYANQVSFMRQYPEYIFVQSSAYHSALMERNYPALFEDMKEMIAAGCYEPNGAVWIECDCNIPSGEYMVRQFVWGQRYTQQKFGYRSDAFWLPDTFGYSASIPQIMKGCGVDYFLTTKMDWNDTNTFPYDTFYWSGLDGSKVLVHLNRTHIRVEPESLLKFVCSPNKDGIKEKSVTNMRLLSYGYGDGGGGPEFESIEMSRLLKDVEGLPRSNHTTVSDFMHKLESTAYSPAEYSGELYLELHRGTLTNQHQIKRNNRLAEIALHNLEYAIVKNALKRGAIADGTPVNPLMEDLLINQFHDILPGTCIARAHEESLNQTTHLIKSANGMTEQALLDTPDSSVVTFINTLSFERDDVVYIKAPAGKIVRDGYRQQLVHMPDGTTMLAIADVKIPAFSSIELPFEEGVPQKSSPFKADGLALETPLMKLVFDEKGFIKSLFDKAADREIRGKGYALNTLLMAEEISAAWDNWDIDADSEAKFKNDCELIKSSVVSDGQVEYRIRNEYRLSEKSTLTQDVVIYADKAMVVFDTVIHWQDEHRFLKAAFDTSIFTDSARQEVQFGYISRPTHRNTSYEKAKFEVCNHKYTDISEPRYGVALINDCKYGISVHGGSMNLSLHKGGNRPDHRGDKGDHQCRYALILHNSAFCAKEVVQPAYAFNTLPVVLQGHANGDALLTLSCDNIIVETIKPCEDAAQAYIVRLYECEGSYTKTTLALQTEAAEVLVTNMLEEDGALLPEKQMIPLTFRPFEIKTLRIAYK